MLSLVFKIVILKVWRTNLYFDRRIVLALRVELASKIISGPIYSVLETGDHIDLVFYIWVKILFTPSLTTQTVLSDSLHSERNAVCRF